MVKKTRDFITKLLVFILVVVFILYMFNFADNGSEIERTGSSLLNPNMVVVCASSICIEYNGVRECVDLDVPTMFKLELLEGSYANAGAEAKNVFFNSLKDACK